MAKIINIDSSESKEKRLAYIADILNTLKASLADMIDEYEDEGAKEKKLDTLTEALDAVEDAYDALNDVLLDER